MYPKAYVDYLVHFHGSRDYFECHEILEEYWKSVDQKNKSSILVAFILFAVSCYHHRRSNFNGAFKTIQKAKKIFMANRQLIPKYGIDKNNFFTLIDTMERNIKDGKPYKSVAIPMNDDHLIKKCKERCQALLLPWNEPSDLRDLNLVHRHKTRDRSDVLQEREKAVQRRKGKGLSN